MIINKKPQKIILDLLHTEVGVVIKEAINKTAIPCFHMMETVLEQEEWEEVLVITDSSFHACEYKRKGVAVLVYLHEGNKEQIFSQNRYFIEGFEDVDTTYFTRIYQREKKLPWVIGETDRLIIREMTPEDTEALYRLYEDKSVVEFMEDLPPDKEEEREYIADYIEKVYGFFGFGMWLVELKNIGEIIGRVGFQNYEEEDLVELGFMIAPEYQHQGYAYEACVAAIAYMREEFPEYKLMARCKNANNRAIELCQRLEIDYRLVD